jgi:hypothetical protein
LLSLNSLSGISLNATHLFFPKAFGLAISRSQFPFWDFFECNPMQRQAKSLSPRQPLNSLSGISLNATDAVSAVFRGIGGENQRVLPLTPLLQQPL